MTALDLIRCRALARYVNGLTGYDYSAEKSKVSDMARTCHDPQDVMRRVFETVELRKRGLIVGVIAEVTQENKFRILSEYLSSEYRWISDTALEELVQYVRVRPSVVVALALYYRQIPNEHIAFNLRNAVSNLKYNPEIGRRVIRRSIVMNMIDQIRKFNIQPPVQYSLPEFSI